MRLFALTALLLIVSAQADATVTYTMVDRVCSVQALASAGACTALPPRLSFEVSDAAVARGSFDLVGRGLPISIQGDLTDLVSLEGAISYRPGSGYGFAGSLDIHVRFAPDGNILSSTFYAYGLNDGALLTGTSTAFGGWFDDEGLCQHDQPGRLCTQTGRLSIVRTVAAAAVVDEPSTTPLLGAACLTLFGLWRSRRTRSAMASRRGFEPLLPP